MKRWQTAIALMPLAIAGAFAAVPSLFPRPASATEPVGSLDAPPLKPEGPGPRMPEAGRMVAGAAAREKAQSRFDLIVSTIKSVDPTNVNYEGPYYSVPRFTGYPGLCAADAYWVTSEDGRPRLTVSKAFKLIGSTEAPGPYVGGPVDAASQRYNGQAASNCEARTASRSWFPGDSEQDVWNALHSVDGIISALQSYRPLEFSIECRVDQPKLCQDARSSLATANTKVISVRVGRQLVGRTVITSAEVDLRMKRRQPMQIVVRQSSGPNAKDATVVEFSPWLDPPT